MGFFSGIKKFVKKNVNIKTAIKVASPLIKTAVSTIGGGLGQMAGGVLNNMQQQHAEVQQVRQEVAVQEAQALPAPTTSTAVRRTAGGPNIGEILQAGAGGALTAIGTTIGGSSTAGKAGAVVADSALTEWFKMHWKAVAGGAVAFFGLIFVVIKMGNHKKPAWQRK